MYFCLSGINLNTKGIEPRHGESKEQEATDPAYNPDQAVSPTESTIQTRSDLKNMSWQEYYHLPF
jgi:hypothetical protein